MDQGSYGQGFTDGALRTRDPWTKDPKVRGLQTTRYQARGLQVRGLRTRGRWIKGALKQGSLDQGCIDRGAVCQESFCSRLLWSLLACLHGCCSLGDAATSAAFLGGSSLLPSINAEAGPRPSTGTTALSGYGDVV